MRMLNQFFLSAHTPLCHTHKFLINVKCIKKNRPRSLRVEAKGLQRPFMWLVSKQCSGLPSGFFNHIPYQSTIKELLSCRRCTLNFCTEEARRSSEIAMEDLLKDTFYDCHNFDWTFVPCSTVRVCSLKC
jgi:hypothetical protein